MQQTQHQALKGQTVTESDKNHPYLYLKMKPSIGKVLHLSSYQFNLMTITH